MKIEKFVTKEIDGWFVYDSIFGNHFGPYKTQEEANKVYYEYYKGITDL